MIFSSMWPIIGIVDTCRLSRFVDFSASFWKPQHYKLNTDCTHALEEVNIPALAPRSRPPSPHHVQNLARRCPSSISPIPRSVFFLFAFIVVVLTFLFYFILFT